MNLLIRLKIGQRLMLAFASVLALTLVVGVFAVNRIGKVNDATADLATNWLVAMRVLGEYRDNLTSVRRSEALHVMATQPDALAAQERRIQEHKLKAADAWKRYETTITGDDERRLAQDILAAQQGYYEALDKLIPVSRGGEARMAEAQAMYQGPSHAAFDTLTAALAKDIEFQTRGGDLAYQDSQATYAQARVAVSGLVAAAIAVGLALAWLITRSITQPIVRAVQLAEKVAAGDLSSQLDATGHDELAQLLAALQQMNTSLQTIVGDVRSSAESIATGSAQIATGNADLSQRTEEQASNLQQTAASMEQLTATVKQNADTARQAAQLAGSASGAAATGGQVVERVVATMDEISASSRRIGDIIGVIDGIAFQTNILALNAAVEAARAGEQGRGFAVVASEVRGLAQRSAAAAKEIKSLIGESVAKVDDGSRLVGEAGQAMGEIVAQVKRVHDLIGEISAASVEQSTGIAQVGDAVSQLDQVTQQNAALVEESAAAAESLRVQAARLAQTVAVFKVGEGALAQGVPSAPPAALPVRTAPVQRQTPPRLPKEDADAAWASF